MQDAAILLARLQALPNSHSEESRDALLAAIRAWRQEQMEPLRARFLEDGDAPALLDALAEVMDACIQALFKLLMPSTLGVAVIATGGYGRRELFPHSDIDLLVIYRPAARMSAERMMRTLLYILWDLGLKVGHALRAPDDTLAQAREDVTIRTALLDARLVVGDAEMFGQLTARLREDAQAEAAEFVAAKLAERDARHLRFGDSRYLLEPNIKESKGGLRDLQTLYWLARCVYGVESVRELVGLGYFTEEEHALFISAQHLLWKLRAHLHYLLGKQEERLSFDRQQALAAALRYTDDMPGGLLAVEKLMQDYFTAARAVGQLSRIVCALLEERHRGWGHAMAQASLPAHAAQEGFVLENGWLSAPQEAFTAPLFLLKLFATAQALGLGIHPRALQAVGRNLSRIDDAFRAEPEANALFLEILLAPRGAEASLRAMRECGLLGRFIPAFGRVVGQMQFNMYHIYTVDEHTLVALGVLHAVEAGLMREEMPLASGVIGKVESRRVLFASLLLHDLAKGLQGDHSDEGAQIAQEQAQRFGFSAAEAEECAWLVRHHLLFTATAFKRDVNDQQTIVDFAAVVRSVQRLRLLLLLTVADMRAVGPGVWNAWKAALLRELYTRTESYIRSGELDVAAEEDARLRAALAGRIGEAQAGAYLALATPQYLHSLELDAHARAALLHAQLGAEKSGILFDVRQDGARAMTEICVVAKDNHALFARLAAAISLSGANIVSARIFTLTDGTAVDFFQLQDYEGKAYGRPERLEKMGERLKQAVAGTLEAEKEFTRRRASYKAKREVFQVEGQVFIENDASATHSVIEVVGRDRPGFLYAVTHALSQEGLTIGSAHISTYGVQAVDVFYVKDAQGQKITDSQTLQRVRARLLEAVEEPGMGALEG